MAWDLNHSVRPARRLRFGVAAAACIVLLSGCGDPEPVTRPPNPPLVSADWFAIWTAVVLVHLLWAAHFVFRLSRGRSSDRLRRLAGSVFAIGASVALLPTGYFLVHSVRLISLVGWERCREIAPSERPVQILQIECVPGRGHDLLWFSAVYVVALSLPLAALGAMCAGALFRSSARPWLPAVLAWIAVVGLSALSISAIGNDTDAPAWLALGAALIAAVVAAVSCSMLLIRPRHQPTLGP